MTRPIGVAVCGLGFMGRTHARAYRDANAAGFPNRLVAICTPRADDLDLEARGNLEAEEEPLELSRETLRVSRIEELLALEEVESLSLCTPTPTHVDLAIQALEAGKHVLVEKPVALSASEIERLALAAEASGKLCMPAMCMRYWPGWDWLADVIRDERFGPLRSLSLRRLGSRPTWNPFYADSQQSGGALFDLHIHDADFICSLFGEPREVTVRGTLDHLTALYSFDSGPPHLSCEGGWDHAPGWEFRMQYTAVFERATADFDLMRDPQLQVLSEAGSESISLPSHTGWDGEVRAFLEAIRSGATKSDLAPALALTRMLQTMRDQLDA